MLTPILSKKFRKDIERCQKRGYKMSSLAEIMYNLKNKILIAGKHRQHMLKGEYEGQLECHIMPDWLLIYKITGDKIYFTRTGTHSDLFK